MSRIIEIGEWTLKRKSERRYPINSECLHRNIELDETGDIVICQDCKVQVSAFWALTMLSDRYNEEIAKLNRQKEQLREDQQKSIHLIAARVVDEAWRSKTMVPTCPHCHRGISVNDRFGSAKISKEFDQRHREIAKQKETAK